MDKKNIAVKTSLNNYYLYKFILLLYRFFRSFQNSRGLKVKNKGIAKIIKDIIGKDNYVEIGEGCILEPLRVKVYGNNNSLIIGKNVRVAKGCNFWMEGNNITIKIGDNCSFNYDVHLCAQGDNMNILFGKDCMIANRIIVRTSDSHPIYDLANNQMTNPPSSIIIGDHVWIAPQARIFKGVNIGSNSIIGSGAIVTKDIPENSLVVGIPAKVVKQNVTWSRE